MPLCRRVRNERSYSLGEGDVVVPMEAMGDAYYRLANNNRVGGAVKAGAACVLLPMNINNLPYSMPTDTSEQMLGTLCCIFTEMPRNFVQYMLTYYLHPAGYWTRLLQP
jgi:hypothetical protein